MRIEIPSDEWYWNEDTGEILDKSSRAPVNFFDERAGKLAAVAPAAIRFIFTGMEEEPVKRAGYRWHTDECSEYGASACFGDCEEARKILADAGIQLP